MLALVALTLLTWPRECARAAQTAPPSHAQLQLIAKPPSGEEKVLWVGVLFHLDPGWHIYWQNPGDSGTPPKIEWHLPAGYKAGPIQWPTPVRLGSGSVIDYGYENQVLLMTAILRTAPATSAGSSISADVKYVVCSEVCIPGKAHLSTSFGNTYSPAEANQWRALFEKTRSQLPKAAPKSWQASAKQDKDSFRLTVRGAPEINGASFLPHDPDEIENSAGRVFVGGDDRFSLTLKKSSQLVKAISTLRGLIVLGPGRAYEIAAPVTQ